MTNRCIDEAQVEVIVSGGPEKLNRFLVRNALELRQRVDAIAQHCRYCSDDDAQDGEDPKPGDRRTWAMWGVGVALLRYVALPALATLLTLVLTGQL